MFACGVGCDFYVSSMHVFELLLELLRLGELLLRSRLGEELFLELLRLGEELSFLEMLLFLGDVFLL